MNERAQIGILLAGVAKNVREPLRQVLANTDKYGRLFHRYKVVVVENGSSDGTKELLRIWATQRADRVHIEADQVRVPRDEKNPRGSDAPLLAGLRNLYLQRVEQEDPDDYSFMVIFDCDHVNTRAIDPTAISTAIRFLAEDTNRAAVFANQAGFYYDIWALRHDRWCPGDCWKEYKAWCENCSRQEAEWACIGSRQIHISRNEAPIEVRSAFGGFAIYKTAFLKGARYCDYDEDGSVACEHVSLHRQIRNRGGRLFVFPSLVNCTPYEQIKRPHDFHYWSIRLREFVMQVVRNCTMKPSSRHRTDQIMTDGKCVGI
jgi:hypothetical protein